MLPESTIREILTSPESHGVLARRYGLHRSAVSQIRVGKIHAKVAPELPRWTVTCERCIHWQGRCDLGHVDPEQEGLAFARDCASFVQR
jgi:hypothetical protein